MAKICQKVIAVAFPKGLPKSAAIISDMAADFSEEIDDKLNTLDQEFYAYPDDLTELLFAFVSKHEAVFGPIAFKK